MKDFLIALQFLTITPIKIRSIDEKNMPGALPYFPLVGLLLGLILIGIDSFLLFLKFEQFYINIILVVSLIILTGGIHLDGLADTVDGLASRKNKEEMLKVMRDSNIGAIGALSLISILLLKITFLSSISISLKPASLILMLTLSRYSLVFSMFLFPYAREEGKAKAFIEGINFKVLFSATIIALGIAALAWQLKGLAIFGAAAISAYMIGRFINNKIGGITGDTLGAVSEIIETVVLLSIIIMGRFIYG